VVTYDTGVNLRCTKPVGHPHGAPECPAAHRNWQPCAAALQRCWCCATAIRDV